MSSPVIEFAGTSKQYGEKRIGPVEFSIGSGEIFGFLGPNGSGKTTCIRMLLGLVKPSAGRVRLMGHDPIRNHVEALQRVGYSPELPNIQAFMSPTEILGLVAAEIGLEKPVKAEVEKVLETVGLTEYANVKVGKMSKGMVQRLSVAQAMIGSPEALVLDEPMIGLDPAGTAHLREVLRDFAREGGTVLMSSHMLDEVGDLCSAVGLIHSGKLLFRGTTKEMVEQTLEVGIVYVEAKGVTDEVLGQLRGVEGVLGIEPQGAGYEVRVRKGAEVRPAIVRVLNKSGAELYTIKEGERMLERAYIEALKGGGYQAE